MKAIIYKSELDYISKCILDYPDIETGGDLFGFWTYSGYPVIQYVIGPGLHTYRTTAFFKQDKAFLIENGAYLNKYHGLQHLGNWHSHHKLGIPHPSSHDSATIENAISDNNLKQFFLVIGSIKNNETIINGFQYYLDNRKNKTEIEWVVLDEQSPIRNSVDAKINTKLLYVPKTNKSKIGLLKETSLIENITYQEPLILDENIWYTTKKGKEFIKRIYNELIEYGTVKMYQTKDTIFQLKYIHNSKEYIVDFPVDFPFNSATDEFIPKTFSLKRNILKTIITKNRKIWIEQDN